MSGWGVVITCSHTRHSQSHWVFGSPSAWSMVPQKGGPGQVPQKGQPAQLPSEPSWHGFEANSTMRSITVRPAPAPRERPHGRARTMPTCVPGVGTGRPGQFRGKGAEQVEEGPGEDDDVVHVQVGLNDHGRQADAFRSTGGVGATREPKRSVSAQSPKGAASCGWSIGRHAKNLQGLFTGTRSHVQHIFLRSASYRTLFLSSHFYSTHLNACLFL